jgi:hypothetical protein
MIVEMKKKGKPPFKKAKKGKGGKKGKGKKK